MIITDVAEKLQEMLNSIEASNFQFVVKSQGFHLDTIASRKTGKNTIPVFVSVVTGENNPVPNLKEKNRTYEINLYFPVRFKEDFFNLEDSIDEYFVGKKVTFNSESALCNVSIAEYGELTDIQLKEFDTWVNETYEGAVKVFKNEYEVCEPYMSMTLRLYTTTLGEGFMFGNDVKYRLTAKMPIYQEQATKIKFKGQNAPNVWIEETRDAEEDFGGKYAFSVMITEEIKAVSYIDTLDYEELKEGFKIYNKVNNEFVENTVVIETEVSETEIVKIGTETLTEQLVWDNSGTGASITPLSEQLIGKDKYARNIPNITNFNKSVVAYIRDNEFWQAFLYLYNEQSLEEIEDVKLQKIYSFGGKEYTYDYDQVILTYNENITLGEPLSFTLTFGD